MIFILVFTDCFEVIYLSLQEIILTDKITYIQKNVNAWSVNRSFFNKLHETVLRTNFQGQKNSVSEIFELTPRDSAWEPTHSFTAWLSPFFSIKDTVLQNEKTLINDRWCVSGSVLKISHCKYLYIYSNVPRIKRTLLFNSFYCHICLYRTIYGSVSSKLEHLWVQKFQCLLFLLSYYIICITVPLKNTLAMILLIVT